MTENALDIPAARSAVASLKAAITHRGDNPATLEAIKTEALLDIAESLRAIVDGVDVVEEAEPGDLEIYETESEEPSAVEVFAPGDMVREIAEGSDAEPELVIAVGESEGEATVNLGYGPLWAKGYTKAVPEAPKVKALCEEELFLGNGVTEACMRKRGHKGEHAYA